MPRTGHNRERSDCYLFTQDIERSTYNKGNRQSYGMHCLGHDAAHGASDRLVAVSIFSPLVNAYCPLSQVRQMIAIAVLPSYARLQLGAKLRDFVLQ
eukprot:3898007-Amphidinium_carterae.1